MFNGVYCRNISLWTFLNDIEKFHRIQTVGRNDKGILQNISTKVLYWIDHDSQWRSYLYDFDKYNPFCYLRKILCIY